MLRSPIVLILSFIALMAFAQAKPPHFGEYSQVLHKRKIIANGLFREPAPTLGDIQRVLPHLKSDIDFLDFLRSNFPQISDNYILVHRTESQQLGSLTHPRVIIFGGGAAFTFSEDPSQKVRKVEMSFTDPKTYQTSLHEIAFENNRAQLHQNPKSCLACHGSPARPLWNPYDFWPNTFGSAIGTLGTTAEKRAYEQLVQRAPKSPLLKRLHLPPTLDVSTEGVSAFTQYTGKLNMGRWIAQNLPPGGAFDSYIKPFIAAAGHCLSPVEGSNQHGVDFKKLNNFLRPSEILAYRDFFYEIHRDQYQARQHFKDYLDKVLLEIFPQPQHILKVDHSRLRYEVDVMSLMRWFFALSGVHIQDMSPSLIANDTLMSLPSDFSMEFILSLMELRPDLFTDIRFSEVEVVPRKLWFPKIDCTSLSRTSLQSPRVIPEKLVFEKYNQDIASRPVISRCSKCHVESSSDRIPSIPFDNPAQLAKILREPQSYLKERIQARIQSRGRGQMPPRHPLSQQEAEALLEYLENLKQ